MINLLEKIGRTPAQSGEKEAEYATVSDLPYAEYVESGINFLETIANLPKGLPDTFGATPLNRVRTLEQQLELEKTLRKRTYDIPSGVSLKLASYIQTIFAQRFHDRAEANEENYQSALIDGRPHKAIPGVEELYDRGELGSASPAELLLIRAMKKIRSVELACYTHPYGNGIEKLTEMRDAVQKNIEFLGGSYDKNPEKRYRVKDIVKDHDTGDVLGYIMTRKRTLGYMPDGTEIRERSSFLLQVDSEVIQEMFGGEIKTFLNEDDLVMDFFRLDEVSDSFLEYDQFSAAIPISSTIYAFNREDEKNVRQRTENLHTIERNKFAKQYPLLFAIMQGDNSPLLYAKETRREALIRKARVTPKIIANRLKYLFTE